MHGCINKTICEYYFVHHTHTHTHLLTEFIDVVSFSVQPFQRDQILLIKHINILTFLFDVNNY